MKTLHSLQTQCSHATAPLHNYSNLQTQIHITSSKCLESLPYQLQNLTFNSTYKIQPKRPKDLIKLAHNCFGRIFMRVQGEEI